MLKNKIINKANKILDEKLSEINRELFETMYGYENIGKKINVYFNLKTMKHSIEIYNGWEPIQKNPYCILLHDELVQDRGDLIMECISYLTTQDEEEYAEKLGVLKEFLNLKEECKQEDEYRLYGDLLSDIGVLEEFENLIFEECYQYWESPILEIDEDDLKYLLNEDLEGLV